MQLCIKRLMISVQCMVESKDLLGEGPVWSASEQMVYWLDIMQNKIHRFRLKDQFFATQTYSERITAIAPTNQKEWIGLTAKEIILFNPHNPNIEKIAAVESDMPFNRFNDGKADPQGRFWAGTMNEKEMDRAEGSLYRIDHEFRIKKMASGIPLCNGMGWSPDSKTMYLNQTFKYEITAYNFDPKHGEISCPRVFAKLDRKWGGPDGLAVDAKGNVWCAQYGAAHVLGFSPEGELIQTIKLPVPNVTSCTFGGDNFEVLFITTARQEMQKHDLLQAPLSGSLFSCCPGVKGLPVNIFAKSNRS